MYRMTKEAKKNKGRLWYKEKGYNLVVKVPIEVSTTINSLLQVISLPT